MKVNEFTHGKTLIKKLPVVNDRPPAPPRQPGNRIDDEEIGVTDLERLRQLAGITMGSGNVKGDADSPLTHGANDKAAYMKKHKIQPGTEEWFQLWFAKTNLTGEPNVKRKK